MKSSKIETMAWLDNLPPYTVIRRKGELSAVYCKQYDEYFDDYNWYLADAWECPVDTVRLAEYEWEVLG